jgi:2,3-dihydroxyphenylpropionate 1,2-dioxygenase
MPPDPAWDAAFLRKITSWDTQGLDAIDDEELDRKAGFGGHEVRTWVAASAAARVLAGGGALQAQTRYYPVIPEWITGMGVVTAQAG